MQIAPLLDPAMAQLGEKDHNAVVLRFFEGRNFKDVSAALGTSEDGAKMRVNRALEKLRKFFTKRGVTLSSGGDRRGGLGQFRSAAPAGLAISVTVAAAKGSAATASTLTLVKGALKLMAWTKKKTAAVACAVVLLTAGTGIVAFKIVPGCGRRARRTFKAPGKVFWTPAEPAFKRETTKTPLISKIIHKNGSYYSPPRILTREQGSSGQQIGLQISFDPHRTKQLPRSYEATLNLKRWKCPAC